MLPYWRFDDDAAGARCCGRREVVAQVLSKLLAASD
jgi:hypothetical protein